MLNLVADLVQIVFGKTGHFHNVFWVDIQSHVFILIEIRKTIWLVWLLCVCTFCMPLYSDLRFQAKQIFVLLRQFIAEKINMRCLVLFFNHYILVFVLSHFTRCEGEQTERALSHQDWLRNNANIQENQIMSTSVFGNYLVRWLLQLYSHLVRNSHISMCI